MTEHTPGEWWAEGRHIAARVPGGRPNGEVIATFGPTAGSLQGKIPDEANARIGAAGPDLLEACKMALEDLGQYEWTDIPGDGGYAVKRTVDKLRTAIAKAEGKDEG